MSEQIATKNICKIVTKNPIENIENCSVKRQTKSKKERSIKRSRNEESWERNVRRRLRSKGETYISVRGK